LQLLLIATAILLFLKGLGGGQSTIIGGYAVVPEIYCVFTLVLQHYVTNKKRDDRKIQKDDGVEHGSSNLADPTAKQVTATPATQASSKPEAAYTPQPSSQLTPVVEPKDPVEFQVVPERPIPHIQAAKTLVDASKEVESSRVALTPVSQQPTTKKNYRHKQS
jgi:hypothetical protein